MNKVLNQNVDVFEFPDTLRISYCFNNDICFILAVHSNMVIKGIGQTFNINLQDLSSHIAVLAFL